MSRLFLGLDAGGSWTRAVVLDAEGAERGRALAAGANPTAQGAEGAVRRLAEAAAAALGGLDPGAVAGCAVGLAGYRALADRTAFAERCRAAFAIGTPVLLYPDAVTAFAAGTAEAAGTVLIAGTGAACSQVSERQVARFSGGLGWLLGDEGSGFWLGREALRHAHAEPNGLLGRAVLRHCAVERPEELLPWAYAGPPRRLAQLAPLVNATAAQGDPAALAVAAEGAEHLAALVRATAVGGEPLVLAGSVAGSPGPVRARLLELLADHGPISTAGDPAAAAARLAGAASPDGTGALGPDSGRSPGSGKSPGSG
ncbi:N-acetylglucosamine kinase [Kitasatospora kifunensis]|uniref:N-acetylglucosamine kinase-like BadF-type ATPase n=1 Tax=Kitasatospora kifunensis TaxID=58351 RepID=A0A7W7VWJ4_KITKI|nr:BadF/BadG/BcrA/BcrD ATPase family protein [Kitasatospora kifunensis]MBB4924749.1 N-acetylglucosamine kinase-like BadF-type ATPase [Kitasatospora kifunensis]